MRCPHGTGSAASAETRAVTAVPRRDSPPNVNANASVRAMKLLPLLVLVMAAAGLVSVDALRLDAFTSPLYERRMRASAEQVVPFVVALRPRDFSALEERLWSVSDPRRATYGRHLSREQANALSRPGERALAAVRDWIQPLVSDDAMLHYSEESSAFKVAVPVRRLEELLDTRIHEYEHPDGSPRRLMRAALPLSVPAHLREVIAYVNINSHPLRLRSAVTAAPSTESASAGSTLESIRRTYGIPDNLVVTNATNTQAIPSFYHESWKPSDLTKFYEDFLPGEAMPTIIEKGTRANMPESPSIEASLDVQYMTGVARNASTYVWTMNGSNPFSEQDEPFVEFAEAILAMEKPPFVVSISYSDDEEHIFKVSPDYARSLDTLLIKMGLRGITVLIASGDDGVAGLRPEFGKLPPDQECEQNGPQWPSASPYITAVGATMQLSAGAFSTPYFQTEEEVVCSGETGGMITTGGAFSNVYPMPDYQRAAVTRYLKSKRLPKSKGFFNSSGRAYPDISALGAGFFVYIRGHMTSVSGTSASTPVVGALVTLWNDIRLNAGKSSLGFINPLIYYIAEHEPTAFNDVVIGNNGALRGNRSTCPDSFGAAVGWDAVSGVGTPNFAVIADFIRSLDDNFNISSMVNQTRPVVCEPSVNSSDSGKDSSETSNDGSPLGMMLLVAMVLGAALVGAMLVHTMVKRWRNQYSSLSSESSRDANDPGSPPGSPPSPTSSRNEQEMIEMSEINLRD